MSTVAVVLVSGICFYVTPVTGYKVVALLLLMTVSSIAMLFEILPVLVAAILSSLIWNFFFIPPRFTFHISNAEDVLMFALYFVIALVNTVLTIKIRQAEQRAHDKEDKEKSIKLYNTLLNSLSHELRTPISTIIASIDTLKENYQQLSYDTQLELLSEIDIASLRLNRQVENLLNMSRLESGILTIKKDWCDINELVFQAIQKAIDPGTKTIIFNPDETLPLFKLDIGLIEQAILNLLNNAILYTPPDAMITIDASVVTEMLVLEISDNGTGFPEDLKEIVFEKFYRLPDTNISGSGLGLSIVKGFVEAHNGRIKLENNVQGGAVFTIQIPAETTYLNHIKNE
jgi:two-component system, OmpR family, sensor histidine kinase KdpD